MLECFSVVNLPPSGNSLHVRMLDFDTFRGRVIHSMRIITSICLVVFLAGSAAAQETKARKPNPLFADESILEVRIEAPFSRIMLERSTEDELPGQLAYTDVESGEVTLDIGIRTRGRYRQQARICPFAPLRLNFRKEQTKKTLFTRTNKVKLVTHCRDHSKRYSQGVLKEYLAYRILNMLTDASFRVRLLRATYVDTASDKPDRVNYAFMIEHDDRMAKRLDMKVSDERQTTIDSLDGSHTNLGSVFQYLIGNTDFSPILGAAGEPCCHNYVLLRPEDDRATSRLSVPYDFDMSGLVNAKHASPNPRFKLRNVRQRLYRGRCANNEHLENTLQTFRDRRSDIEKLIGDSTHMNNGTKKSLRKYIDDFYASINNPKAVKSRMIKKCI